MALTALFVDTRPRILGAGSVFIFDGTIAEAHEIAIDWTREPIEDGSEISDNRVILPRRYTLTAIVSPTSGGLGLDPQRAVKAWGRIEALAVADPAHLFTVTSLLKTYRNMGIVRVTAPVTSATGDTLQATILFEEKQLGSTAIAENLADAARDGGLAEEDLGNQGFEAAA